VEYGPRLYRFFAPLTIVTTLLAVLTAVVGGTTANPARWLVYGAAFLAFCMIVIYFAYFKQANARFAKADMSAAELAKELVRWEIWHWVRVAIGLTAFITALIGLARF
jgi:purine-cytosine permease-like protein